MSTETVINVRIRKPWAGLFLIGFLIGAAFAIAACGDGDDDGAAETSTSTSQSTTSDTSTSTTELTTSTTEPTTTSSSSTTGPAGPTVEVYYGVADSPDCGEVEPFERGIADEVDIYLSAFEQLVAGPTPEEASAGAASFFSNATAGVVKSAVLDGDLLRVDFTDLRPLIPNASTSCGSEALLAQLNSTAFQFTEVQRTRYLIDGNCSEFANWLQRDCFDADRSGAQLDLPVNERAAGAGCTPSSTDTLPEGRWFGFVVDAEEEQLSFDLACWFTGAAAAAAATEDGEESPPPNDYYIRNVSDRIRIHFVDSGTRVEWLPNPGDPASAETVSYETWLEGRTTRGFEPGVWLTVEDDSHVIRIEEQYVP